MGIESEGYNVSTAVAAGFVKNDGAGNFSFGELGGGGGGGSGGGAWDLIEVKNITVAATTLTFSGLDGDTDGEYMLLYRVRKLTASSTGAVKYQVRPNGATTNISMVRHAASSSGANSVSNVSSWEIGQGGAIAFDGDTIGRMIIDANRDGLVRSMVTEICQNFPTFSVPINRHNLAGIWTDLSTNLTSLDIVSTEAGGIEVGSYFCLYKKSAANGSGGAIELIETINVTTAVTSVSFAGLDGDTDKRYKFVYRILKLVSASTPLVQYQLRPNGVTTGLSSTIGVHSSGGGHASFTTPSIRLHQGGGVPFDGDQFGEMEIDAESNTGALRRYFSAQGMQTFPGFGTLTITMMASEWTDITTNITSLDIVATEAGAIAAGSTFSLYRVNA